MCGCIRETLPKARQMSGLYPNPLRCQGLWLRSGRASCCVGVGQQTSFKDFSTYSAKAIAGIGKLPDTVADRAIPIRLKRAAPGERVERFRPRDVEIKVGVLKGQIVALCKMLCPELRERWPELPEELTDRQQDGAEPLLAIADSAGNFDLLARRGTDR